MIKIFFNFLFFFIFSIVIFCESISLAFEKPYLNIELKAGDLIFQDLDCPLAKAIKSVTPAYHGMKFAHVGIFAKDTKNNPIVIEAHDGVVIATPLKSFLARTVDNNGNPRICVAKVLPEYQKLVPIAVKKTFEKVGLPYNFAFDIENKNAYYCAQLIYEVFKEANNNIPVFKLNKMTFKEPGKNNFMSEWITYFKKINYSIPEGKPGINPGAILCSGKLIVIYP